MKTWLGVLMMASVFAGAADLPPVKTVPQLDLNRYVGKWYEIASFPMFFQRMCKADTTAEYGLRSDGDVSVKNRCRKEDGSFTEVTGSASVVSGTGNAKLKVSFFWPFSAPYWVVGLDTDYRWAVVGNPDRDYLWILARSPQLSAADLDAARAAAQAQGFDLGKLKMTPQTATP